MLEWTRRRDRLSKLRDLRRSGRLPAPRVAIPIPADVSVDGSSG
jgi:hypothetical protein